MNQQELLEKSTTLALRGQAHCLISTRDVRVPPEDLLQLQKSYSEAWETLKKVQADLAKTRKEEAAGSDPEASLAIQKAKEKLLEGTTQAYKDKEPSLLPASEAIQQSLCIAELEKTVRELYDVLRYIKSQRKETKEELEREKRLLEQREQIREALTQRTEQLESAEDQQELPGHSLVAAAKEKQEKAEQYHRKLMKRLGRFIEHHFPPPAPADITKWEKKRKLPSNTNDLLPLQAVIQELMNKSLDPGDPYIQTDDHYWPLYMQLLVRCGVAQRDPGDDTRFKMTPFHL